MTTREPVDDEAADPCPDYVGLLARDADGGLASGDRARLDAHLLTCPRCRAAVEAQRAVRAVLAEAFVVEASPQRVERVLGRLRAEARWSGRLDYRQWTYRLVPVAAALIVAAYLTATATGVGGPGAETGSSVTEEATTVASLAWSDVSPLLTTDDGNEVAVGDVLGEETRP